jgi:hypothetical protein
MIARFEFRSSRSHPLISNDVRASQAPFFRFLFDTLDCELSFFCQGLSVFCRLLIHGQPLNSFFIVQEFERSTMTNVFPHNFLCPQFSIHSDRKCSPRSFSLRPPLSGNSRTLNSTQCSTTALPIPFSRSVTLIIVLSASVFLKHFVTLQNLVRSHERCFYSEQLSKGGPLPSSECSRCSFVSFPSWDQSSLLDYDSRAWPSWVVRIS